MGFVETERRGQVMVVRMNRPERLNALGQSRVGLVADQPIAARFHAVLDERGFTAKRFVMGRSMGSHPAFELLYPSRDFRTTP